MLTINQLKELKDNRAKFQAVTGLTWDPTTITDKEFLDKIQWYFPKGAGFDKEHIARFAEGNKAEAIIPLENDTAMQPFVNAVAGGLLQSLAPILAQQPSGYNSDLPPMYVGTLIADDNGIKELYKKFRIIQVQENARRGTVGGL